MSTGSSVGELPSVFVMSIFTGNLPEGNKVMMGMFMVCLYRSQTNIISFFYICYLIKSLKQTYVLSKMIQYKDEETEN